MRNRLFLIYLMVLCLLILNCKGKTEEDFVIETVEKVASYAEDKDVEGLLNLLTPDYKDSAGRTVEELADLVDQYLERYPGIAIHILATKVNSLKLPEADITTEVQLSSGAAQIFRKLVKVGGYYYRFDVKLVKKDKLWLIKSASWLSISQYELSIRSKKNLKDK